MRTILIVEDEYLEAIDLARQITRVGFDVRCESTGLRAVEVAGAMDIEAIIVDIQLPDISGREVVRELRKNGSVLPIIVCTAYASEHLQWASDAGLPIIQKPVDESLLVTTLRRHLGQERVRLV